MSWRERLQPALFGGIRFYVNSVETVFGRRGTLHEYAFGSVPFAEDVGKKAKEFSFNAYLFDNPADGQSDYLVVLQRLIERIESGEKGELVHPSLGKIIVRPLDCVCVHDGKTGGFETLTLKFVEAGENRFPNATNNTTTKLNNANIRLGRDVITQHKQVVILSEAPDYQSKSAQNIMNKYLDSIESAVRQGVRVRENVEKSLFSIDQFRNVLPDEIVDAVKISTRIVDLFDLVGTVWSDDNAETKYNNFNDIYSNDLSTTYIPSQLQTPDRLQEKRNNDFIKSEFRVLALNQMALASDKQTFKSSNKVFERRNDMLKLYGNEIEVAGINKYDNTRNSLINHRSVMIEGMNKKGADLPSEKIITLNDSVSSFALGYELYADSFRGEEIASENKVRHPLFLPPQQPLLVLTR